MLTQLPARRCWINAAKRRLCVWPNSSSTQSPLVSSINSKSTPDFSDRTTRSVVLSNHSTGSGGEERTSGLRPETLTSTAHGIFSLGLLLQTDIRKSSNRDVSKSHSVRTRVRIFSQSNFSAGKRRPRTLAQRKRPPTTKAQDLSPEESSRVKVPTRIPSASAGHLWHWVRWTRGDIQ